MNYLTKTTQYILAAVLVLAGFLPASGMTEEANTALTNEIQNVDFTSLTGGRVNIRITLKEGMSSPPPGFALNSPARIALDFAKTANGLNKSNILVDQGVLKSLSLAQAKIVHEWC